MAPAMVLVSVIDVGRLAPPVAGLGTQTVGLPPFMGIPLAPGNVPKYESNERFSCMMMMTCLIL